MGLGAPLARGLPLLSGRTISSAFLTRSWGAGRGGWEMPEMTLQLWMTLPLVHVGLPHQGTTIWGLSFKES